jgi:hypothetical protein
MFRIVGMKYKAKTKHEKRDQRHILRERRPSTAQLGDGDKGIEKVHSEERIFCIETTRAIKAEPASVNV